MPPKVLGGFINPAGFLTNSIGLKKTDPLTAILDPAKFIAAKTNMPMIDFAGQVSGTTKQPNPYPTYGAKRIISNPTQTSSFNPYGNTLLTRSY